MPNFIFRRCLCFGAMLVLNTVPNFSAETAAPSEKTAFDPEHAVQRAKGLALFKSQVRPLLIEKCVNCHGGDTTESKLDLSTQEGLFKGGERGPAAVIGRGSKSLMTRVISHRQEPAMPKGEDKLTPAQIDLVTEWIDLGAPYDEPLFAGKQETSEWTQRTVLAEAKLFWSFKPLQLHRPPDCRDKQHWITSAVDQFILNPIESAGILPNPVVSRSTLIRRLHFDVLGLPPSPDEISQFTNDPRPDAYERLVDCVLANPHYGERWGRRWLDLARFAESHGFEHDYDRASAFHYRDFVVQALNEGMPYDQFIRWQIAGDELAPDDRLALMATGYLAAGVHSTQITKNEVEKHRYDEMDDMLSTIGTSLLGLTIGCARCHDHKFDPIPQADYYRLLSTFTTTIRSEVELDFDPEGYRLAKSEFDQLHEPYEAAVRDYETRILPGKFREWILQRDSREDQAAWIVPDNVQLVSEANAAFTPQTDLSWLVTGPNPANDIWTVSFKTDLTGIRSIRLEALADPSLTKSGPGRASNGNFALTDFRVLVKPAGDAQTSTSQIKLISAKATFEQNGLPVAGSIDDDPESAWAIDPEFGKDHSAVFIAQEPFGLGNGSVITIRLKFHRNVGHSIGRLRLSFSRDEQINPTTGGVLSESILSILQSPWDSLTDEQKSLILNWYKNRDKGWKTLEEQRSMHSATAPKPRIQKVLIATEGLPALKLHTQAEAEFLNDTHFLRRGEANSKVAVATQNFLQVLMADGGRPQHFQLTVPPGGRTSFQRASMTNWLVNCKEGAGNLLARVITNRVWQHHLGRGIVASPSDFGTRGEQPTHPELLDWLALQLVRFDWQLKPLHRLILTSSVYQQSCEVDLDHMQVDRENKLLWHRPRWRLEAEVIRDAILTVCGLLNDRLYGPGQLDESHLRRSLYFTVKRSQLIPSMAVFDAPDGTTPVAERLQTTIAPQALLLINSPHIKQASNHFAKQLVPVAKTSTELAVRLGYLTALSRNPLDDELADAVQFIDQQAASYSTIDRDTGIDRALADFCQVLFCLNEFIYIE